MRSLFVAGNWLAWAGRIGADSGDSSETALRKRLVVLLFVATLPATGLWSVIYFLAGAPLAAAVPGFYALFTPINTAISRGRATSPTSVCVVIGVTFGLLFYFVGRRNFFQERSETLLLNILPKEVSELLKIEPRTIAEQPARGLARGGPAGIQTPSDNVSGRTCARR